MEPWQSWTLALAGAGGVWYYYATRKTSEPRSGRRGSTTDRSDSRVVRSRVGMKSKHKKDNKGHGVSGSDSAELSNQERPGQESDAQPKRGKTKKQRQTAALPSAENESAAHAVVTDERDDEDDRNMNREFALQMAGMKTGTSLARPAAPAPPRRTTKPSQSSSAAIPGSSVVAPAHDTASPELSTTSSTTGADADDDLSPAMSPDLPATTNGSSLVSGDVSDMLDAPGPAPSVLRITPASVPVTAARAGPAKAGQPTETKKQRQNRRKAEEQKAARAEAEAGRRMLLEKQLRTAREAEGRPARNGVAAPAPAPAPPSAWPSATAVGVGGTAGGVTPGAPLLDTFGDQHPVHRPDSSSAAAAVNGPPASKGGGSSSGPWPREVPSEEEQMRILHELSQEVGWNTVQKGRRNKKTGSTTTRDSSTSEERTQRSRLSVDAGQARPIVNKGANGPAASALALAPAPAPATVDTSFMTGGQVYRHPADSDWAVL
ncbi:MAG: hypothetical protein M1826_005988 [Phylliscum demangeonii]|nr:MAG: hypothetical protein M1826_005988 [Phylliscum demangeonii]